MSDAKIIIPPFSEFVEWLRADPDRVLPAKKEEDRAIGMVCLVGVFMRSKIEGPDVGVGMESLLMCVEDASSRVGPLPWQYTRAIVAFDNATHFMRDPISFKDALLLLEKTDNL